MKNVETGTSFLRTKEPELEMSRDWHSNFNPFANSRTGAWIYKDPSIWNGGLVWPEPGTSFRIGMGLNNLALVKRETLCDYHMKTFVEYFQWHKAAAQYIENWRAFKLKVSLREIVHISDNRYRWQTTI